jgi:tetratricopeptide (TPR) repeat protein
MTRQAFAMSPNYLTFIRGIRELHRLAIEGRDESPEADAIRDATDGPWEALSEAERKRLIGLSEDLYSISEPSAEGPQVMNPQAQARLIVAVEARTRGEWDRALELLRRWGKHVSPALVSYLRGSIWWDAGDPSTAVLFYKHAVQLDPQNGNYLAIFLHVLDRVDPGEAQRRAEGIIQNSEDNPPEAVVRAASVMLMASLTTPEAEEMPMFRRLIPVLERAVSRIAEGDEGGIDRSAYCMAVDLLGSCHEFLGDSQQAIENYTRGLQADPHNDALLVARGILLYGSSPRAITDFELATQYGSPLVWPYFFLAHHHLINRRFEQCRSMCERASRMPASNFVMSELAEWSAISQSELGFPVEMIRAAFENSIRLDASNERARRNLAAFEEAVRPARRKEWQMRSEAAVRTSGLSERRTSGLSARRDARAA